MSEAKIDEFPCIYPASREFPVFRDGFARDCLLQQRVRCELDLAARKSQKGRLGTRAASAAHPRKVETAGGAFQVREDDPAPRVGAGLHRTP